MTIPLIPPPEQKNIFFFALPAWGHNKPLAAFGFHILQARPDIVITAFTDTNVYPKLISEIDRICSFRGKMVKEDIRKRFNVIDVCGNPPIFFLPNPAVPPALKALWNRQPIKCLSSGKKFESLSRPVVAVIDPFLAYVIEVVREITIPSWKIPILSWMTAPIGACLRLFGPKEVGGFGSSGLLDMKTIKNFTMEDLQRLNAFDGHDPTGKLVEIPGVPTMYDYEYRPQEIALKGFILEEFGRIYIPNCDGMLCVTSSTIEASAIAHWNRWFETRKRALYTIGPLTMPKAGIYGAGVHDDDPTYAPVVNFLDRMQEEYGEKSVVYISLGSLFWPVQEDKFWGVVREFIEHDIPVILAHSASQPEDEKLKIIKDSPVALSLKWAPQETILSHPATGWFVSHGGWNSTQEALRHRVPQIFWPFAADQPHNAALMSRTHRAGFELFNVRSGENGTKIPYVFKHEMSNYSVPTFTLEASKAEIRDLITRLQGEEGSRVRENFERLADKYVRGWDKHGEARRNMEAFLARYVDGTPSLTLKKY
ncbi:UDP-Glycosyltransferase/glycogen phosphorylase [Dendrothele bispora CBS 962.96]|uniref:UDP-Glycosyltransferase/glycogen phosphorylase n=1 Tax=Dendrothele bispora (strain CBS 962.96) TaxID=1314807 RepID=A0A4S8MH72_DENBC|nr:UDP-Glycosyltransferase/glycogen phosphorylase [Dendrothele bispora CBS 962.96]